MNIVNGVSYGIMKAPVRKLDRKMLTSAVKDEFVSLNGPKEKSKAKKWVAAYTLANAGVAFTTAQAPGGDEAALATVEGVMAAHIFNAIYDFKLTKTALTSILTGYAGNKI